MGLTLPLGVISKHETSDDELFYPPVRMVTRVDDAALAAGYRTRLVPGAQA